MQFAITLTTLPMIPLSTSGHMIICKEEEMGVAAPLPKLRGRGGQVPANPALSSFPSQNKKLLTMLPARKMSVLEGNP